jgi:hypothetical protein
VEGESMALIKCIECGKVFSDKASSCPECACPTNVSVTDLNLRSTQIISDSSNELPNYDLKQETLDDLDLNISNNNEVKYWTNTNSGATGDFNRPNQTVEMTGSPKRTNPYQTYEQHKQEHGIDTSTPKTVQDLSFWKGCGICCAIIFLILFIQYFSNSSYSDSSDDIRICNNLGGSWDAWSRTCR